ncbi:hypothetical protein DPMN_167814 [Dreissena polymorpha]|uniref:Uncharacterized protein n=1 Tax=Dreissena polymorpha TaxID=45954 RepID=A0A9D4F1I9_DREPO|nr:hypothetical protein DPMN_167814 [Dreissena polymorpha]
MLTPRIMKLHRYIDHDWQMTRINFQRTHGDRAAFLTVGRHRNAFSRRPHESMWELNGDQQEMTRVPEKSDKHLRSDQGFI